MHFVEAKGILSAKQGMNIYRGCTHGCIYCDSRSACYGFEHAFEDVEVKQNAPELLEKALRSRRNRCMIGTGSMCDPYLRAERELCLTRRCLEIIEKYGFGVSILTKSDLILRDIDILERINEKTKCVVQLTITTFDDELCRVLEPNVCPSSRRFEVLAELSSRGIPTVVWLSPLLPFINDTRENIEAIVNSCAENGVRGIMCFGIGVTAREGSREHFYAKLDESFPSLRERYTRLYGNSYVCNSPDSGRLMSIFQKLCKERGMMCGTEEIFSYLREFEDKLGERQMSLF